MLSILIPVYKQNIVILVQELHKQAIETNQAFEIIVADDASDETTKLENRAVADLNFVQYIELKKNIGRSKIRNKLFSLSKYNFILFMDCDAKIASAQYIQNYLNNCNGGVVCGGTAYETSQPEKTYFLRWLYGHKREQRAAAERNENPNISFTTFNFMVPRAIFEQINFDESLNRYGHEDTLFGYELKKQGFVIKHIDNPLIHTGLDSNKDFIIKGKQSVKNLYIIATENTAIEKDLFTDIKILSYYKRLRAIYLTKPLSWLFILTHKKIENQLNSSSPKLVYYDLLKLGYLCTLGK